MPYFFIHACHAFLQAGSRQSSVSLSLERLEEALRAAREAYAQVKGRNQVELARLQLTREKVRVCALSSWRDHNDRRIGFRGKEMCWAQSAGLPPATVGREDW